MLRVAVVGGGITGLAAAYALRDAPDVSVTVFEGAAEVGGKLRVSEVAGLAVDEGAEQVLVRRPEALRLIEAVGLGADVVHPRTSAAGVWSRGALRPLPPGTVLGVPADPWALARSGVLSWPGLARAALDLVLPRTRWEPDIAVGGYVAARAGRELVDRLVDPLLGGVYAGRADALSLRATVPQLAGPAAAHRTLLAAARASLGPAEAGPVFATVRGGLGRLPTVLAAALAGDVRTGSTVRVIEPQPGGTLRLVVGSTRDAETVEVDGVIVAVPAHAAGRLLSTLAPPASAELAAIETASTAIVTLVLPRAGWCPPQGSGFLVPVVEGLATKAVTFASSKWAHLDDGPGVVVRASLGRAGSPEDLQRDDDGLVAAVRADLALTTGCTADPLAARVTRWGGGLPQYAPGHLDRVARVRAALPGSLAVAGAAYDGVGVPACIGSGEEAAQGLVARLRQSMRG